MISTETIEAIKSIVGMRLRTHCDGGPGGPLYRAVTSEDTDPHSGEVCYAIRIAPMESSVCVVIPAARGVVSAPSLLSSVSSHVTYRYTVAIPPSSYVCRVSSRCTTGEIVSVVAALCVKIRQEMLQQMLKDASTWLFTYKITESDFAGIDPQDIPRMILQAQNARMGDLAGDLALYFEKFHISRTNA